MRVGTENAGWMTPIRLGFLLTFVVILGFACMAWQRSCLYLPSEVLECRTNWGRFLSSPPNEVGDTLAGFSGTLAFIWIIITVWIQGHELREQRKELELTRSELTLAREAQEKQLEVMQKQADIFEDEKNQRSWDRARKVLDELLERLAFELRVEAKNASLLGPNMGGPARYHVFKLPIENERSFDYLLRNKSVVSSFWIEHDGEFANRVEFFHEDIRIYENIRKTISEIIIHFSNLPDDALVKIKRLDLNQLEQELEDFLKEEYWHHDSYNESNFTP